ncbi:MAG: 16S rRNA (cytosine(1402)-N(4))-methyltransferase RsmH [Woeseiaceae bacterium]|nr:16S rRNA (cytosine(1402)-N(4))-methyltransferase RsmH [Woeseiaceae bacterium]NIP21221.1 16S rRNA (cytosine(1402)-N(4))-methyltransferase RsmH [Woeseiaceae bacterium]NIS90193.1 16S rRNA (cytosine(1402)-N(4))-methyltransferase RsmH [Woeseiaceae bacterium]
MSSNAHVPVLLGPVLHGLDIKKDGIYVDGTFGRGGHSSAILKQLGEAGRLVAIDRDPEAIANADDVLTKDPRFELVRGEIEKLAACIEAKGLTGRVDGLLLDLGVSSPQLDQANRGFSFLRDGPLDMRMDPESGISAADWLEHTEEKELRRVLKQFGEEKQAGRIARAIVAAREAGPLTTTLQLADVVTSVVPAHTRKTHPATKTFQAIRIYINRELEQLEAALDQSLEILARGGRLCVISFHSLEDRIVKRFIRTHSREHEQYRGMPDVPEEFRPRLKRIGRPITATADEIAANARARSARLRVAERL